MRFNKRLYDTLESYTVRKHDAFGTLNTNMKAITYETADINFVDYEKAVNAHAAAALGSVSHHHLM